MQARVWACLLAAPADALHVWWVCCATFILASVIQVQDLETTKTGKGIDRSLCYGPDDFRIGSFVNVYGRNLYLHDCDEFTRGWYKVLRPLDISHEP